MSSRKLEHSIDDSNTATPRPSRPRRQLSRTISAMGEVRKPIFSTGLAIVRPGLINRFRNLYQTFFKSYTEKVWGVPCNQISAEWGAQRIKGLSVWSTLRHAMRMLSHRNGSDPRQKGYRDLCLPGLPHRRPAGSLAPDQRRLTAGQEADQRQLDLHPGTRRPARQAPDLQQLEPVPGGQPGVRLVGPQIGRAHV